MDVNLRSRAVSLSPDAAPDGWKDQPLGQFVSLQRGHDLTERQRRRGDVPVMGSAGINGFHDTALARGPGVVLGRSGASFGQAHFCECDYWPHNTALYVTDFHGNNPRFVFYYLKAMDFSRHNSGGAQQSLNRNFISPIPVSIPDSHEQESIANVLSDADALIESLEQLLAKKRQLKQGAMQELLTGKRRLPGFSGEWDIKRIGDVADTDPENLGSNTPPTFLFQYIALEDVDTGTLRGHSSQVFASAPSRARRILRNDDILVATVRPNLKSHLRFVSDGDGWVCSTGFCVVRCIKDVACPGYIYSHLFADPICTQIQAVLTGSNYPAINSGVVRSLLLPLPSFAEQNAIAEVLSDIDTEIAALEAKLAKARQIKQGMMQELLTGRIRLVAPQGATA